MRKTIIFAISCLLISLGMNAQAKTLIAGKFPEGVVDAANEKRVKLNKIPSSLEELRKFQRVIIAQEIRTVQKHNLSEAQALALRQYLLEGGTLFITGSQSVLIGFEPFPDEKGTFAVNQEAPLRLVLPIYSEPNGGGYGRFADFGIPRMGPGGKAVSILEIKKNYPEFQKYLDPRFDFGGFNFVENRPETKVVAYTVMKKPEDHGYMEKTIFGFAGRRGVLTFPIEGRTKSAKSFKEWPLRIDFLKSCLKLVSSQKAGAFITSAKGPEKLIVGEKHEFTVELRNADDSPKKYELGYFLYQPGFFKLEKLLERKNVVQCELRAKGRGEAKCQVEIPTEFTNEPGAHQLVFTLTNSETGEVEHSIYLKEKVERKVELTLNPGASLSFTDREDIDLKVRVSGAPDKSTLKILVSYEDSKILSESRELSGDEPSFKLKTDKLPYGEYKIELQAFSSDGKLLAKRYDSLFLDPKYEKDDFRLGMVSWFWYSHPLNRYYIKNMRRLGMSLCRGNFSIAEKTWPAPIWRDKNSGKIHLFKNLLKKKMLSYTESGEIICSDKNLVMEPQIDISYWYTWPLPDYARYGMDVMPIIGPSCTAWNKKYPSPWIYDLFSQSGKPVHFPMNQKGEYAKSWSNIKTCLSFKPMVELEKTYLKQITEELDKKYQKTIPAYQVQNEPTIWFTAAKNRGMRDFNPANLKAFRKWLKDKYKDLATFNKLFDTKFTNWEEIEPPRKQGKLGVCGQAALLAEFKIFQDHVMVDWLDECMGAVHEANPEKTCVSNSVHWVDFDTPKSMVSILNGNNYFLMGAKKNIDCLGQSDHSSRNWDNAMVYDTIYSAAHAFGKFGWVTEGRNYFPESFHQVEARTWAALFHGSRVYTIFSQPFFKAGRTSNMFNHDISICEKSRGFGRVATFMRDNCYLVRKSLPHGQHVGLLLLPEANYLSFAVSGDLWPLSDFHALYKLFHYQNIPVKILDQEALTRDDINDLKMIIVPDFKFGLEDKYLRALKKFHDKGGSVLTFARFGFQDRYFRPAAGPKILSEMGISINEELSKTLYCKVKSGKESLKGHLYVPVKVDESKNNKIIGTTTSGKPAIVRHDNGKSYWYYSATNMPKSEFRNPDWIKFLVRIMKESGVVRTFDLLDESGRRLPLERYAMRNPENSACFAWAYNPSQERSVKVKFHAPELKNARFYDFDKQKYLETISKDGFYETKLTLPGQYSMILGLLPANLALRETKIPTCRPAFVRTKVAVPIAANEEEIAEDAKYKISQAKYPETSPKENVSAPDAEGFVKTWNLIGPFSNPLSTSRTLGSEDGIDQDTGKIEGRGYDIDYLKPFGGEANPKVAESASVTFSFPKRGRATLWEEASKLDDLNTSWNFHESSEPLINLIKIYPMPPLYTVAYAVCEIDSDRDREVLFRLGSDDGFKLYLNGKELGARRLRRGAKPDDDSLFAELKKGRNQVVLKIGQDTGGFGFYFRITDLEGTPVSDLKIHNKVAK